MAMYLWLKLLAFGFAFLDTEVFVTGKHFNVNFYFLMFCSFCGEGLFEMDIFKCCVMETENKLAGPLLQGQGCSSEKPGLSQGSRHCFCSKDVHGLGEKDTIKQKAVSVSSFDNCQGCY